MDEVLSVAVEAARRAADILRDGARRLSGLSVEAKAPHDYVTDVDRAAEKAILETIRRSFPGHAILAEESGEHRGDDHVWIIDPLDGTTNFIHGMPHYCVSIAVRRGERIEQAVILDPVRDELFEASVGRGARLNGNPIRVTARPSLEGSLLGTGIPYRGGGLRRWTDYERILTSFASQTAGIRRPGSAALDLAYVASGRYDGFWEFDLRPWDIAAGALLTLEAGGRVTDLHGGPDYLKSGDVLAAGPAIHEAMRRTIAESLAATAPAR